MHIECRAKQIQTQTENNQGGSGAKYIREKLDFFHTDNSLLRWINIVYHNTFCIATAFRKKVLLSLLTSVNMTENLFGGPIIFDGDKQSQTADPLNAMSFRRGQNGFICTKQHKIA